MLFKTTVLIIIVFCLNSECIAQRGKTILTKVDTFITCKWVNDSITTVRKDIERLTGYTLWDPTEEEFNVTKEVRNLHFVQVIKEIYGTRIDSVIIKDKIKAIVLKLNNAAKKKTHAQYILHGHVVNKKQEAVSYATVNISGTTITASSDIEGNFQLSSPHENFTIVVTAVNYKALKKQINGEKELVTITMEDSITKLNEVAVIASRKLQATQIHKDTVLLFYMDIKTGAKSHIDSSMFNWSSSQNIADRLPTGIVLNSNTSNDAYQSPITIRNRITIIGYPHILVILNGVPFQGDLSNINPNDIESIEVIKDAAASTQYGLHAGNGVLIIVTKSGAYNTKTKLTATTNTTIGTKPNLSRVNFLNGAGHIEFIKDVFNSGYYDYLLNNVGWYPFSPIVTILHKQRQGLISANEAELALTNLSTTDIKSEARKYLYTTSVHQQYHIGIQGGDTLYRFNFSQGYDVAKWNLIGNNNTRLTTYFNHAIQLTKKGPEIYNIINLTQNSFNKNGLDIYNLQSANEKLADEQGNPLAVTTTLNQAYKDSLTKSGKLLNWNNKPLEEIALGNNKINNTALHVTFGLKYHFFKKLEANIAYRHETETSENINHHSLQSYFTRNTINTFTQFDSNGNIYRPVPLGAIIDRNTYTRNINNIIGQLKYEALNNKTNTLIFQAGTEIRHFRCSNRTERNYGVTRPGTKANVDNSTYFSTSYAPGITYQIPLIDDSIFTNEHYYSIYANGIYTWKKRLQASLSYRKDESNIFGVQANLKGIPLIAAGISWDFDLTSQQLFSLLRVRLSDGYCSNASRSVSSLTGLQSLRVNAWNAPMNMIVNPPNPQLSWERVHISNIGFDFSLYDGLISGSTDFFTKRGVNLLGIAPIDPTSGFSTFPGNVAAMRGHGLEVTLNTKLGSKKFQWQNTTLMSIISDKVTTYYIQQPAIWYYCDPLYLNPVPGKPLFSMYSLHFRDIDANGNPIGAFANQSTKDYNSILLSPNLSDLIYHGPATPTFYGSFRNSIRWNKLELGINIVWKAGYYIRTSSVNYNAVIHGEAIGHSDIAMRWRQPGDELITKIPSLSFPIDHSRELFYNYSSALVERGDHIRLQDIRFTYNFNQKKSVYIYANNIGLLWKATRKPIDPDFVNNLTQPLQITIGTKIEL